MEKAIAPPDCSVQVGEWIPAFRQGVRLREESRGGVIIADDDSVGSYLLLSPLEGFLLALFDGTRTIRDVAKILSGIRDSPDQGMVQQDVRAVVQRYDEFIELTDRPRPPCGTRVDPRSFLSKPDLNVRPARPDTPLWVDLYVTRECNLKCNYCFAGARYVQDHRDREDFRVRRNRIFNLVDQVAEMDIRRLLVTGGEPILVPYLPDVIRRLTDYGIQARLATNASLMTDKLAGRLREAGLERIQAKLDAGDPVIQDALAGITGTSAKLLEGIKILKRHSFRVTVASVVTALNIRDIPRVIRTCAELGVNEYSPRVYQAGIWALEGRGGAELNPSSTALRWLEQEIARMQDTYRGVLEISPLNTGLLRQCAENSVPWCSGFVSSCTVLDNGLVVPCETLADLFGEFVIGDANQASLVDIWNSPRAQEWLLRKRPTIDGPCISCDEFARCKGGCAWKSYVAYGRWVADPTCIKAPPPTRIPFPTMD